MQQSNLVITSMSVISSD